VGKPINDNRQLLLQTGRDKKTCSRNE